MSFFNQLSFLPFFEKKGRFFFSFVSVCLVLQGCSGGAEQPPGVVLENVSLAATLDANENTAVSIDLVMVYEKNLFQTIKNMTSEQYFTTIDQVRLDNPDFLYIWRWELVPGQVGDYHLSPVKEGAWGMMLFADYQAPGKHRASVGPLPAISVIVENKEFRLKKEAALLSAKIIEALPVEASRPLNTRVPVVAEASEEPASPPEESANPEAPPPAGKSA